MAQYVLKERSKFSRRVDVRKSRMEIKFGSLLLAFLLACLVWLYIVGSAEKVEVPAEDPAATEDTVGAEDAPAE